MADNRLAREVENRESAQRKMTWTPPQTLPEPEPQPGWVFRWIRTSIMGQADPNSRFKGNIEIGGLLLCKAPEELMKQRDEFYAKQAQDQVKSVDNNFMRLNDERMPLFSDRKSSTSFGKGK
jgi:hypothetical protein